MGRKVYIIDDEREVRLSMGFLLRTAGVETRPFGSGDDFLEALADLEPGCLLLDVRMPEVGGLQVLEELAGREIRWPVIVMTGDAEVATVVQAMKLGAFEFLEKPLKEETLFASLERGFGSLEAEISRHAARKSAKARISNLSAREIDVLRGLQGGMPNRTLATCLNLSHRTIEMHRGNMMRKLGADGLPDALRIAADAGLQPLVCGPLAGECQAA
ncbi:MAG TPA: response regulator [Allosphingosinicella sp.]|jgi:two-component system response regulator FixJ